MSSVLNMHLLNKDVSSEAVLKLYVYIRACMLLCSRSHGVTFSLNGHWGALCHGKLSISIYFVLISLSLSLSYFFVSLSLLLSDCCGCDPALLPLGNQCLDWSGRHRRVSSCTILCGHQAVPDTKEHPGEDFTASSTEMQHSVILGSICSDMPGRQLSGHCTTLVQTEIS